MASTGDLVRIKESAEPHLFSLPNVNFVGTGRKFTGGVDTGREAIVVFVSTKRGPGELAVGETVPTELEGIPTDVVEIGGFVPLAQLDVEFIGDTKAYRPRLGGGQIGWTEIQHPAGLEVEQPHAGTLGCVVRTQGTPPFDVILTNKHVVTTIESEPDSSSKGREIGQPDTTPCSSWSPCCNHIIGRLLRTVYSPDVDGALIALAPGSKWQPAILELGQIAGINDISRETLGDAASAAIVGMSVHKRGMKTRKTDGTIYANNINGPFPSPPLPPNRSLHNQIMVKPSAPGGVIQPFSLRGDSGSVVVDDTNNILGLLFSGSSRKPGEPGYGFGLFSPIQRVVSELNIAIVVEADAKKVFEAPANNFQAVPNALAMQRVPNNLAGAMAEISDAYADIAQTKAGSLYDDLGRTHYVEVRNLIRTNKRVAVTWQRNEGPEIAKALWEVVRERDTRLPSEVNGKPVKECLRKIQEILLRYGSAPLAAALRQHTPRLVEFIGLTYGQIFTSLQSPGIE